MIDRSYLPFKSAREYQDRGMMKWMGFFLSEHTSSLIEDANHKDTPPGLSKEEKLLLLGQLYVGQFKANFWLKTEQGVQVVSGHVYALDSTEVVLKLADVYDCVALSAIVNITLIKEEN